jgi:saccharopine dehydrogenase-like NADP-dependent oxidoreductase
MHTVLVLGGYGFFGARIAASLAQNPTTQVLIAGRDHSRAKGLVRALDLSDGHAVQLNMAS